MHCDHCGHAIINDKNEMCTALLNHFVVIANYIATVKEMTAEEFEAFETFMRWHTK